MPSTYIPNTELNLWDIPLRNTSLTPPSSSDLKNNSPFPVDEIMPPTPEDLKSISISMPLSSPLLQNNTESSPAPPSSELQVIAIPEKNLVPPPLRLFHSELLLPVQNNESNNIPPLDLQDNVAAPPLTTAVSPPPTNSSQQALNTAAETNGPPPEHDAHTMWLQYLLFVGGVCYAAVSATLQALQGTRPLSTTSKIVYAALLVSFTIFVLSVYIRTNYPRASTIAVHVGSLFGFAVFFVALFSSLTRHH